MNTEKRILEDSKFFDDDEGDISDNEHLSPSIKFPNATYQFRNVLAKNKGNVRKYSQKCCITKRDTFYDSKVAISFVDKSFLPKYIDFSNIRSSCVLCDKFECKGICVINNPENKTKGFKAENCEQDEENTNKKKNRKFSEYHHDSKQSSFLILSKLQDTWR